MTASLLAQGDDEMAGRHTDTVAGASTVLLAVGEGLAGAVVDEVGGVTAEGVSISKAVKWFWDGRTS